MQSGRWSLIHILGTRVIFRGWRGACLLMGVEEPFLSVGGKMFSTKYHKGMPENVK